MLRINNLHAHYGDSHVIQGVTITVGEGECVALLGRNGAGKTTTLRTLLGYLPATRGEVIFNEERVDHLPVYERVRLGIGYVPENRGIFRSLTVLEHIRLAASWARVGFAEAERKTFEMFPRLAARTSAVGSALSGGEQQMLAIARAIIQRPALLVLDEPSEGLAPIIIDALFEALVGVIRNQGVSILVVEQNDRFAGRLADRLYVLSQGRVTFEGDPIAFRERDDIRSRFLAVG